MDRFVKALGGKATPKQYADGEPCDHPGCLSHISHPCEGCGRRGGMKVYETRNERGGILPSDSTVGGHLHNDMP